jgi:hypothetical protein
MAAFVAGTLLGLECLAEALYFEFVREISGREKKDICKEDIQKTNWTVSRTVIM